ncbi:hypothetical protein ABK040_009169 [Willaertia magna]
MSSPFAGKNLEALKAYALILRTIRKIPKDAQMYYRNHSYQHFVNHRKENDPERIQIMIERVKHDVEWIKRKFNIHK